LSTATNRPTPVLPPARHIFDADGPFVSAYLTTDAGRPDAADQVALRWRNLRRQLADDGASEEALAAVDPLTVGAYGEGESSSWWRMPTGCSTGAPAPPAGRR
jgi:hypothetical protein